jgi:hypothetical protein
MPPGEDEQLRQAAALEDGYFSFTISASFSK